jgi:glycosyltransferase involved in cell wall biosynthesis
MNQAPHSQARRLRILFVNRMASMVRGGGETFDLEMARHLAALGCEVTFLTGVPLFGKAKLGPEEWWRGADRAMDKERWTMDDGRRTKGEGQEANDEGRRTKEDGSSTASHRPLPIVHGPSSIAHRSIRSPYTGWFPWDKTPGGWRLRVADFKIFEYVAALWTWKHRGEFDVIQVCELPYFVSYIKRLERRSMNKGQWKIGDRQTSKGDNASSDSAGAMDLPIDDRPSPIVHCPSSSAPRPLPIVLRLTAPDFYDPVGGVSAADAAIASGDTMRKIRAGARPDCHDIPNGVDVDLFKPKTKDRLARRRPCEGERPNSTTPGNEAQSTMDEETYFPSTLNLEPSTLNHEFRQKLGIPPDAIIITHIARFQSVKNHTMLIKAFATLVVKVPTARLVLAGSGPLKSDIENQVRHFGLTGNVVFLGETNHADLPSVYAAADINVMPSDYESFCFAVLEGMASGLPHVVTETNWVPGLLGGTKDEGRWTMDDRRQSPMAHRPLSIVHLPGGLVTPIGDADAFADALLMLARDPELRGRMGQWNRERVVSDFTWDASAKKLLGLYERLTGIKKQTTEGADKRGSPEPSR